MDPFSVEMNLFSIKELISEYTITVLGVKEDSFNFKPSISTLTDKNDVNHYLLMEMSDKQLDVLFRTASRVTVHTTHVDVIRYPSDPTIYNDIKNKLYAEWNNEEDYLEWKISQ